MNHPVRVYLVDDHEIVRRGLRHLIEAQPDMEVVGDAADAERAIAEIGRLKPDVAVLDVRLGQGPSGIEVCREVRSRDPEVKCVMLTSYDDDEALFAALMAGANGYLLKEIDGNAISAGIRGAAEGRSVIDAASTARVIRRMEERDRPPSVPHELAALTRTEREILGLIAEGLTNRQIGERIYLAEKTVKNHVTSILAKLGLTRRTQAAVLASRLL
ncbi:MAG: response regulator [Marmoricola sp.]